jgi:hypothetical protein
MGGRVRVPRHSTTPQCTVRPRFAEIETIYRGYQVLFMKLPFANSGSAIALIAMKAAPQTEPGWAVRPCTEFYRWFL